MKTSKVDLDGLNPTIYPILGFFFLGFIVNLAWNFTRDKSYGTFLFYVLGMPLVISLVGGFFVRRNHKNDKSKK